MTNSLQILISDKIIYHIQKIIYEHGLSEKVILTPYTEASLSKETAEKIKAAYISRDITGKSTKHEIASSTQNFYETLLQLPNLQWVHTHSAGLDRAIFSTLKEKKINVSSSSGANSTIVAQSVLGAVIALNRKFKYIIKNQSIHRWMPLLGCEMPHDLENQRALIVGWGPIGKKIYEYLSILNMDLTIASRSKRDEKKFIIYNAIINEIDKMDWLILACPLSIETYNLINENSINKAKYGLKIINVSRGEIIDEKAMIKNLKSKKISNAYLDVFRKEPLEKDSELWNLDNVIVSPHSAAHSAGNRKREYDIFIKKIKEKLL